MHTGSFGRPGPVLLLKKVSMVLMDSDHSLILIFLNFRTVCLPSNCIGPECYLAMALR